MTSNMTPLEAAMSPELNSNWIYRAINPGFAILCPTSAAEFRP
jgi:hypothetical protein